jgi:hypothetical protein
LIFDKGAKTIQWKKESIFNKWCYFKWWVEWRRMQSYPFLSPCTKLMFKWIQELHMKTETLIFIEENMWKSLEYGHRRKIPEQISNGLCCKIKNRQMRPHKIAKLL